MGKGIGSNKSRKGLPSAVLVITCVLVLLCDVIISMGVLMGAMACDGCHGFSCKSCAFVFEIGVSAWAIIGCIGPVFWTRWGLESSRATPEGQGRRALAWALIILSPIMGFIVYFGIIIIGNIIGSIIGSLLALS